MLWKITDNVKYEEDCEVSWARCSPAPPQYSLGGGGRWAEAGGKQGCRSSKQTPAAAPRWDGVPFSGHSLVVFSGDPFLNRAFS